MPQGLHEWVSDIDAWATYLNQTVKAINDGFVLDQSGADGTGVLTTRATYASTTTFTVAGDATAFYVAGRRLRIVHAGGTTYCSVTSSAFAAVTTVTIGTITQGPATMTTPITSMAVSPVFTGNAGNAAAPSQDGPTGGVVAWLTDTAPTNWLLCYGQAVSRTTYAALFAVISTVFGVGDGSTTFNLPDTRGRVLVGQDDMGGVAASRIAAANAIGVVGGSSTHTLTTAELASHAHSHSHGSHLHSASQMYDSAYSGASDGRPSQGSGYDRTYSTSSATPTTDATTAGSGSAHNNVQPYLTVNYIVRT